MAARKKNWVDTKTREKIQTTQLIKRLQAFALGLDEPNMPGKKCEMTPAQVKSAQVLINKRMPDLSASDINLNAEGVQSKEEMYEKVKEVFGEELAAKICPDFVSIEHKAPAMKQ